MLEEFDKIESDTYHAHDADNANNAIGTMRKYEEESWSQAKQAGNQSRIEDKKNLFVSLGVFKATSGNAGNG